jgi:hypothetical protein
MQQWVKTEVPSQHPDRLSHRLQQQKQLRQQLLLLLLSVRLLWVLAPLSLCSWGSPPSACWDQLTWPSG